LGDKRGAIEDYEESLQRNDKNSQAWFYRGNALTDVRKYQEAIVSYDRAIQVNADWGSVKPADARANRALARLKGGDNQGAIEDYSQALQLNPSDAGAHYYRGVARASIGDKKGALEDFQNAGELYQKQGNAGEYQKVMQAIKTLQE
jgi:tetratricopeptide (TPR) repeat protein